MHLVGDVEKAREGVVAYRAIGSLAHDRLKGCDNCDPLGSIKMVGVDHKPWRQAGGKKRYEKC